MRHIVHQSGKYEFCETEYLKLEDNYPCSWQTTVSFLLFLHTYYSLCPGCYLLPLIPSNSNQFLTAQLWEAFYNKKLLLITFYNKELYKWLFKIASSLFYLTLIKVPIGFLLIGTICCSYSSFVGCVGVVVLQQFDTP